jgi:hypothetical protein
MSLVVELPHSPMLGLKYHNLSRLKRLDGSRNLFDMNLVHSYEWIFLFATIGGKYEMEK